ncbi:hypothetical protein AMTRI_Chr08g163360 [Amborella trichopoda]
MILIIFNVLSSTKEPLKCPIMKFLVIAEIFRGKRKVPDEEEKYLMRRSSCRRGGGRSVEKQSWRRYCKG